MLARLRAPHVDQARRQGRLGRDVVLDGGVIGGAGEYVWYAAAKGGIDALNGLAREVAKEGIRVNAVRPGATDTDIHEPGRLERITPMLPMGRPGQPDEMAEAILFLLSDAASYISGAMLRVSGALLAIWSSRLVFGALAAYDPARNRSTQQSKSIEGVKHGRGSARTQTRRSRSSDLRGHRIPAPGQGQIKIKQHACGVNFIDTYFRMGMYPSPVGMPFVAGNESAGEVIAVGPGVTDLKVGDRVAYVGPLGGYAAERVLPADRAVKLPDNISYEQAAGMMLKGMTVQYLVNRTFKVGKGTVVPDARRRRRRRPDRLPMGQSSRRHRHRHRRLQGQGRTRQGERRPPHHPLSRRGFRGQGQGDHQRQAVRRGL